jgi:Bacterial Ig-like domain (group 3)
MQVVNKYATVTSLVSTVNPSLFGQAITLTASVVSQGPSVPTGRVTFKSGSTILATAALDSNGFATLTRNNLPAGALSLTATYNGDSQSGSSVGSLSQAVNPVTSTASLTSSRNPSTFGQSVTLTATVTTTSGVTATGTVTFTLGQTTLGIVTLSGGKARLTLASLPRGANQITATYSGTPASGAQNIMESGGSLTQQVN